MGKPKKNAGYKNPPVEHQFKPGQSGNPKGRPRRSRNLGTMLAENLEKQITVTEGGVQRRMTKREAIANRVVNGGLTGSSIEQIRLLAALEKYAPAEVEQLSSLPEGINIEYVKSDGNGRPLALTDEEIEWVLAKRKRLAEKARKV